jgi:hypothetical protein
MKFAQLFILILAFLVIRPANAGLLIEPVVGFSSLKFETDNAGSSEEDSTGLSLGGRLGYQNLGLQLGLDYLQSTLSVDDNNYKDLNMTEFGGFIGFEFPVLLRVYAGYMFSVNGDTKVGGQTVEFTEGSGTKFGLGFTGLPFVDINFEYRKGSFGHYDGGVLGSGDIDTTYSAYMIGLSLPFVL